MLLFLAKGHAKYMVLISEVSSQESWLEATGSFSYLVSMGCIIVEIPPSPN